MGRHWTLGHRVRARVRDGLLLSANEERYVLAETMTSAVYAIPWVLRLSGPLDEARLEAALAWMCRRHEAFRTGFESVGDGTFRKYVERDGAFDLKRIDAAKDDPAAALHTLFFSKPDLTPASLRPIALVRHGPDDHELALGFHHSIVDGQSLRVFVRELFDRYASGADAPPPLQFSDVIDQAWRDSGAYAQGQAWFAQRLADFQPGGSIPDDRQDPALKDAYGYASVVLDAERLERAKAGAEAIGVSLFTYFYAVTNVALSRLIGSDWVVSAFQSNGRRSFPESKAVIGAFSNAIVLPSRVQAAESLRGYALRLHADVRAAIANEAFPYHHVISEFGVHPSIGINWYPALVGLTAGELAVSPPTQKERQSDYDLNFRFLRLDDRLEIAVYYRPGRVQPARVQHLVDGIGTLAAVFAGDVDQPVSAHPSRELAPPGLLPDATAALDGDGGTPIYSRFLAATAARPDATALSFGDTTYSYAEVEARSRAMALELSRRGMGKGDRVAIVAGRHPSLVWTLLGVSRAGAAFALLDSRYPAKRLADLTRLAAAKLLLVAEGAEAIGASLSAEVGLPLVDLRAAQPTADEGGLDRADPDDPAYLLFTSGSTGTPKCVVCAHGPLSHFVDWQAETFGLSASDRFTMLSGLSHDPLLRDVFTPLSLGASLMIPEAERMLEPGGLRTWFRQARPTVAHMTPPLGELLVASKGQPGDLGDLRLLFWGGDMLQPQLLAKVSRHAPDVRHVNFYGSTETPQAAAWFEYDGDPNWKHVPIGRGSEGFQVLVVDKARQPVGVGEVGEIAVRSNYLSLGYFDGARTSGVRSDHGGVPIYYTGDLGFYLPDGTVMPLGRQDDQVKVRGYRVELSEIDSALHAHAAVRSSCTLVVGDGAAARIVSFVADDLTADRRHGELIGFLAERLPDYMLPSEIVGLAAMPLMPNGKVDRAALRALAEAPRMAAGRAPQGPVEEQLCAEWASLLGREVSPDATFRSLGGDSLSLVQIYLATEDVIGVVPKGWQFLTLAELAASKREKSGAWTTTDTPMLIRAVSISLVVMGHLHLLKYGGGATTALFMVSGFLFGGLQLREAFSRASASPILRALVGITIPTFIYAVFAFSQKSIRGRHTTFDIVLLNNDLIDYSKLPPGAKAQDYQIHLWYVDAMIKIFAFLLIAFVVYSFLDQRWKKSGRDAPLLNSLQFAGLLFAFGCATRFLLPGAFDPDFFVDGVKELTVFAYSPTTHLATFMLGVLLAHVAGPRSQGVLAALCIAYALVSWLFFDLAAMVSVLAAGAVLIAFDRVALPRPVAAVVLTLSGASLFIFLTHFMFASATRRIIGEGHPALETAAALLGGAGLWFGWNWLTKQFNVRRKRGAALREPVAA